MEYVVYWRSKPTDDYVEDICKDEEALATAIQNLQVDWDDMSQLRKLDMKVFPLFKPGQMVLNIKNFQTRIVKTVHVPYRGKLVVYNHDNPDEAELQKWGHMPRIFEEWSIQDCVPVDWKKARMKHNFQFGTAMGKHARYAEMQAREMSSW